MTPLAFVIEDDYDASEIYSTALEMIGYTVEVMHSGDEAIQRLTTDPPSMIVLDWHLPHMSGRDILARIREDKRLDDLLIFVASADSQAAESVRAEVDLVLQKPVTYSQLSDFAKRFSQKRGII